MRNWCRDRISYFGIEFYSRSVSHSETATFEKISLN